VKVLLADNVSSAFKMEAVVLPKPSYLFTEPHGSRTQNISVLKMFHFCR